MNLTEPVILADDPNLSPELRDALLAQRMNAARLTARHRSNAAPAMSAAPNDDIDAAMERHLAAWRAAMGIGSPTLPEPIPSDVGPTATLPGDAAGPRLPLPKERWGFTPASPPEDPAMTGEQMYQRGVDRARTLQPNNRKLMDPAAARGMLPLPADLGGAAQFPWSQRSQAMAAQARQAADAEERRAQASALRASLMSRFPNQRLPNVPGAGMGEAEALDAMGEYKPYRVAADEVSLGVLPQRGQPLDAAWALGARRYPTSVEGAAADPASVRADLERIVFDPRARQEAMATSGGRYDLSRKGPTDTGTTVSASRLNPGGIRLEGPAGKYDDKEAYTKHLADRQKWQRDRLAQSRRDRAQENLTARSRSRNPQIANQANDLIERLQAGPSDGDGAQVVAMMRQLQRAGVPPQYATAIVRGMMDANADVQATKIAADAKAKAANPEAAAKEAQAKKNEAAAEPLAVEGSAPVIDATRFGKARDWRFPEYGASQAASATPTTAATAGPALDIGDAVGPAVVPALKGSVIPNPSHIPNTMTGAPATAIAELLRRALRGIGIPQP